MAHHLLRCTRSRPSGAIMFAKVFANQALMVLNYSITSRGELLRRQLHRLRVPAYLRPETCALEPTSTNAEVLLAARPLPGEPLSINHFEYRAAPAIVTTSADQQVLCETLALTFDPSLIPRFSSFDTAPLCPALTPGVAVASYGVGRVVASGSANLKPGDIVVARQWPWREVVAMPPPHEGVNFKFAPLYPAWARSMIGRGVARAVRGSSRFWRDLVFGETSHPAVLPYSVGSDIHPASLFEDCEGEVKGVPAALRLWQPSAALGVLGESGLAAWFACVAAKVQPDDVVVVTSAAGAVGHLAAQLAKVVHGGRVVGVTSTAAKAEAVQSVGVSDVVTYKEGPGGEGIDEAAAQSRVDAQLLALAPGGVDVHIDLVGGGIGRAVDRHMKKGGRVVAVGDVGEGGGGRRFGIGPPFFGDDRSNSLSTKGVAVEMFSVYDYLPYWHEVVSRLEHYVSSHRVSVLETVAEGLHAAPSALLALQRGECVGRVVVLCQPRVRPEGFDASDVNGPSWPLVDEGRSIEGGVDDESVGAGSHQATVQSSSTPPVVVVGGEGRHSRTHGALGRSASRRVAVSAPSSYVDG